MTDVMLRGESAVEFFKELVEGAITRQRVNAAEPTSYYVVTLLARFMRTSAGDDEPMSRRLAMALESGGVQQKLSLREIGDLSLFVSGFFSDSFRRKLVDVDYYIAIGGYAYATLSRIEADTLSPVFGELAEKFVDFVDVLSEVSERTSCTSNTDLLRLYERWLRTGSPRSRRFLIELGVVPGTGSTRIQ